MSTNTCATPQTLFWSNLYKGHLKIAQMSWKHSLLIQAAGSCLLPETLCRNVGWLNCRSSLLLAWNKHIKYLCLNKKEPRAAVSLHFQAKALQGDESSARKHFQETLKVRVMDLLPPELSGK